MPVLQIDAQKISIEDGHTILDAARQAGIEIPTLCWYPTLSIVGNCRICLVSVEGQPKLIPACATKVADGLVVTTRSHAAVENRRGVLKLLAERYPAEHDPPRHVDLHPVHSLRAGLRGHSGRRRPRRRVAG